jgi:clan AA aspartic protease
MISGIVRDLLPRIRLLLPGQDGPIEVEFVVDTGFEGELAVPGSIANQLEAGTFGQRLMFMADRTIRECPACYIDLEWNEDLRSTEVLILDGNPLLGMYLMNGFQLQIEAREGGEVYLDPL